MDTSLHAGIRHSALLFAVALGFGSCASPGDSPASFDATNKVPVAEAVQSLQQEQQAILSDLENCSKVCGIIASTQGKPDQKILDGFNERVDGVNKRLDLYKTSLIDMEKNASSMLQRWREALTGIRDPDLDRSSRANLEETRETYEKLDAKLRDNYARMDRLGKAFREQKIFMQVNPAVEAAAPLKGKLGPIEQELWDIRRQVEDCDQLATTFRKKLQP